MHTRNFEFYCLTWERPLWVKCKLEGEHSWDSNIKHSTIELDQAINEALYEWNQEDKYSSKKKLINSHINQINEKIKELKQCVKDVEEQIYEVLKKTLHDLSVEFSK